MKRDRYRTEVQERERTLLEWVERVFERRGEAPYELLCAWRAAHGVEAHVPYPLVHIKARRITGGLMLRLSCSKDVLMYAHGSTVLMYAFEGCALEYNYEDRALWPWTPERVRSFQDLPFDIWQHFARVVPDHQLVPAAYAPLCRAWRHMWTVRFHSLWKAPLTELVELLESLAATRRAKDALYVVERIRDKFAPKTDILHRITNPTVVGVVFRGKDFYVAIIETDKHTLRYEIAVGAFHSIVDSHERLFDLLLK